MKPSSGNEQGPNDVESEEKDKGTDIEVDEEALPSRAAAIHEEIRRDGEKELERDGMALLWSAIAAGLSMGASLMAKGIFQVHLDGVPWRSCLKTRVIPLVLLSSSWRVSSCLPKIPSRQSCR